MNDKVSFPLILFEIISPSVVIGILAIPLAQGKVAMNKAYGIRTKKAFKSKENWDALNRYGGKVMLLWSIILLVVCLPLAIFFRNNPEIIGLFIYQPLLYLLPAVQICIYSGKLP